MFSFVLFFYRTATLEQATDNAKVFGKEVLKMFNLMKLNVSDMRGVSRLNNII